MAIANVCVHAHAGSVHGIRIHSKKMLRVQHKRMGQPCVVHTWAVHTQVEQTKAVQ
jgi:hypothetical protein